MIVAKRVVIFIAWGLGAIVLTGALIIVLLALTSIDTTYDRTADWSKYNTQIVSNYFKIPNEATIRKAIHTDTAIMGMRFYIEFSLPTNKLPEVWLQDIATRSGMKERYKRTNYLYDCDTECDLLRLEYLPDKNIYIAEAGWD